VKVNGSEIIFSTGKTMSVNGGIIGLSEPTKEYGWEVTGGWDDAIDCDSMFKEDRLTKSEKIELVDYMVGLWQRFKNDA